MAQLVQHRHGGQVERVAGIGLEGTDAALTEDDTCIAAGHDILRAHQKLLQCAGKAALEEDRLVEPSKLRQKVEVLHIARADLNDVHVLEKIEGIDAHDLGDDGKPRLLPCDLQKLEPLCLEPLKGVRRGARLESAAAQKICACALDFPCDGDDLLLAFDRARPCDRAEVPAADFDVSDLDHSVLGVGFAAGASERIADLLDRLNDVKAADTVDIDAAGVADETENGMIRTDGNVDAELLRLKPADELIPLFLGNIVPENDKHDLPSESEEIKKRHSVICAAKNTIKAFYASQITFTMPS